MLGFWSIYDAFPQKDSNFGEIRESSREKATLMVLKVYLA